MRVERFKMEREGLVTEGQEVEISERSAVTGQYTYLVEPSIAMSGIYRTRQRIRARKGKIKKIEQTDRGFYLLVAIDESREEETKDLSLTQKKKAHIIYNSGNNKRHNKKKGNG